MSQQSQAQAQISALQQQNAMLNQHLHSQAQSHINHLQQLLPFHQPPHLAHPSPASFQSTPQPPAPQAPDPPTPAATPASQSGPSMSFNPDEILQQMKSTVESSIQALVEKTQERQVHSIPTPPIPVEIPPRPASHPTSTPQHPPLQPQSSRRSRSHHHRSSPRRPDKRPVSAYRSPRRRRSSRHHRRSSRHRSNSRDASRHRRESSRRDRDSSITLKSASPHRRDHREQATDYYQPPDYSSNKPILQAAQWWTNQQSTDLTTPLPRIIPIIRSSRPKTSGNRGEGRRIIPSILPLHINLQKRATRNPPITTINPTILPQNHSQHSLPLNKHRHPTKRKNLSSLVMTNLRSP